VLLGLAVLTKGPVGFLLPVIAIAVFALLKDNLHGAIYWRLKSGVLSAGAAQQLRIRFWPVPLKLGWGLLIVVAVVAPWLVVACIQGGAKHTYELLFHQNFNRYFDSWTHTDEPFYIYFVYVALQVLPWTLLLPVAIALSAVREPRETRWARRFPLIWFLTVFLFFTFCSSKREIYTVPLLPAAGLMLGGLAEDFFALQWKWTVSRIVTVILYLAPLALTLGGAVVALAAIALKYHEYLRSIATGSVILLLGIAAVVWLCVKRRHLHALILIILSVLLAWTATYWTIFAAKGLASLALKYHEWIRIAALPSAIWVVGGVGAIWLCFKRRSGYVLALTMLAILLAWTAVCWTLLPYLNRDRSAKIMFAKVRPFVRPGETLYTYGTERNGYDYYWNQTPALENLTKYTVTEWNAAEKAKRAAEQEARFLAMFQGAQPVLCLMAQRTFDKLKTTSSFKPHVLLEDLMGSRDVVFVSNQQRSPSAGQ